MFIVIEGIDGSGVGTQAEILREKLMTKDPILFLRYPDYNDTLGVMIHQFLHGKLIFQKDVLFLLYFLDQLKDREKIEKSNKSGMIVLADRYFTSNLAYQCAENFDLNKALQLAKLFDMPKPDLAIFLKILPESSVKRKLKEKGFGDIYEKDVKFQKKASDMYEKLAKEKIFAKEWIVIDGEKPMEEVTEEIQRIVFSRLK